MRGLKVDPTHASVPDRNWEKYDSTAMVTYTHSGDPSSLFFIKSERQEIGTTWMSPTPFTNGSMRFAWYLWTSKGLFVVKAYNEENVRHIQEGLGITLGEAINKDVRTYAAAQHYASMLAKELADTKYDIWNWNVRFVEPCAFRLGGTWYFGERFLEGNFLKWNTNTGENNLTPEAQRAWLDCVAGFFSHYTYAASKGKLMVVDIQGMTNTNPPSVTFTDPQIHTRAFRRGRDGRKEDALYKRFSVGNLGKTGMKRFFANHKCNGMCQKFKL